MFLALQWLGGACYLLNKVFLLFSERALSRGQVSDARRWRISSWLVYIVGLPPWVIIFISRRDWIAASVEASGGPAMVLGLVTAFYGLARTPPRWLDHLAVVSALIGFSYSLHDFGGLRTLGQVLEIGLVLGYLVGTFQLAKHRAQGYLWYMLMHVTCAWLMQRQGYTWLFAQQVVSLGFILWAYIVTLRRR